MKKKLILVWLTLLMVLFSSIDVYKRQAWDMWKQDCAHMTNIRRSLRK